MSSGRAASAWAASADRALVVALMRGEGEPPFVEEDVNFLSLLVRACAPFVDREIFVSTLPTTGKELTGRQREVLGHLLYGSCEKEIAGYLSRSVHTVHTYIKQIYSAFGVNSRGDGLVDLLRPGQSNAGDDIPCVLVDHIEGLTRMDRGIGQIKRITVLEHSVLNPW